MSGIIGQNQGRDSGLIKAPAGGGGMTLIGHTSITSSTASVDFTSGMDNAYPLYKLFLSNVKHASDGGQVYIQVYQGGSLNTSSHYTKVDGMFASEYSNAIYTSTSNGATNAQWRLHSGVGNSTGEYMTGEFLFFNGAGDESYPHMFEVSMARMANTHNHMRVGLNTCINAGNITGIKIYHSAANISLGEFGLFGINTS